MKKNLKIISGAGINRLSIGLQSSNNNLLKMLGRIHNFEEFLETYKMARKLGMKNINVDLMIGLPMQTLEDVSNDLKKIKKLNPEHISMYSLIVEENTPMEMKIQEGTLKLPSEEIEREEYWLVKQELEKARIYTL